MGKEPLLALLQPLYLWLRLVEADLAITRRQVSVGNKFL